jgi:large subunit ribosomal protein L9e
MKYVLTEEVCNIPDKVEVKVQSRNVEVKGPRGTIKKAYKHVPLDIFVAKTEGKKQVKVQMWLAKRKQRAKVRSVASSIQNMLRGVTTGFKYKMRLAYAHFPIQTIVTEGGKKLEIKNFIGEKVSRIINAVGETKVIRTEEEKDVLTIQGVNLDDVSKTCALIQQSCRVKNKDIRQFLDGIYVSEKRLEI